MAINETIEYVGDIASSVGEAAEKVAEAVRKVDDAVRAVVDTIDSQHIVAIRLVNLTDTRFEFADADHDNGNWANGGQGFDVFPAAVLEPRTVMGCVTQDIGFLTGTKGDLTYRFREEQGAARITHSLTVQWDNGFWSPNQASAGVLQTTLQDVGVLPFAWPTFAGSRKFRAWGHIAGGRRTKAIFHVIPRSTSTFAASTLSSALQTLNS